MVGTEYQAEVPSCLCHYKEGEKGDGCFYCFSSQVPDFFFIVMTWNIFHFGSDPLGD